MAKGYRNIRIGSDHWVMAVSPMVAIRNATTTKRIAHTRYFGPLGKITVKASEQLVTNPTAVFRQATVTVTASIQ